MAKSEEMTSESSSLDRQHKHNLSNRFTLDGMNMLFTHYGHQVAFSVSALACRAPKPGRHRDGMVSRLSLFKVDDYTSRSDC